MATHRRFEDLDIWQRARQLSKEIYKLSNTGTFAKDFGLRDQINRATGSVMDNIAEVSNETEDKNSYSFFHFRNHRPAKCALNFIEHWIASALK